MVGLYVQGSGYRPAQVLLIGDHDRAAVGGDLDVHLGFAQHADKFVPDDLQTTWRMGGLDEFRLEARHFCLDRLQNCTRHVLDPEFLFNFKNITVWIDVDLDPASVRENALDFVDKRAVRLGLGVGADNLDLTRSW